MTAFEACRGSGLSCRTDFTFHTAANLNFYDAAFDTIPFHVSLRPFEGLIVINRRDREGWRRELRFLHAFDLPTGTLEVTFGAGSVQVSVDGCTIGRFDRFPRPDRRGRFMMRRGFPGLGRIAHIVPEGGIMPGSLALRQQASGVAHVAARLLGGDAFSLDERLELSADVDARAVILPNDEALPLLRHAQQAGRGHALLPGRIWQGAGAAGRVRLALCAGDAVLDLDLDTLCDWFERVTKDARLEGDDTLALLALEHARFSGLFQSLSSRAQGVLWAVAARFGLTAYLAADLPQEERPAIHLDAFTVLPDEVAEHAAVAQLARHWREQPEADPARLLTDVFETVGFPGHDPAGLMRRLTEVFCLHDAFPVLYAAGNGSGMEQQSMGGDRWNNAVLLPWLAMGDRVGEIPDLLYRLGGSPAGWLATPAVAWGVRTALDRKDVSGTLAESIIYAWIALVDQESATYWGRLPCREMLETSVRMLRASNLRPGYLQKDMQAFAVRCYGLQPDFWAALGEPQDPVLAAAKADFDCLTASDATPAGIASALDCFAAYYNKDVPRYRRVLLGPAGVPLAPGQPPEIAHVLTSGVAPGEALLRHALFPDDRLALPAAPSLRALAGQSVAALWQGEAPPMEVLQREVGQRLPTVLSALHRGALPDMAEINRLLTDFHILADPRSAWLGPALALVLLTALADCEAGSASEANAAVLAFLQQQPRSTPEALALRHAPAVVAALAGLEARLDAPDAPDCLAQARALFSSDAETRPAPSGAVTAAAPAALHDLIVVVFSCRPNLETRIPAMRSGWLADLAAHGIPYIVIAGAETADDIGRREGDVVFLDCSDDYEGLPQKTLAAIAWVHGNTRFARMMKIDDDCFIDAAEMFGGLQHLKFDYYGRPLSRSRGEMDRAWHNLKSQSLRGRLELDKSPEPSLYADGGSGYVLSRRAMSAALEMAASPAGKWLISLSFMEDKMLGDLLALANIHVQGQGYRFAQERRSRMAGMTVPFWTNGPRPFRGSGIAGVHLDGHANQAEVHAASRLDSPVRSKIWPSWQSPRFGWSTNTLDLLSPQSRLRVAAGAEVAVVACLRNEMFMLPHFLDHYRKLGVGGFLIADNCSDDGTTEYLAEQPDVALFSVDTPYGQSHYGVAWQEALLAGFRVGRWTLAADADELLVWDASAAGDLPALLREAEFSDADAVRLFMLDMYPEGPLSEADFKTASPFAQAGFADRDPFLRDSASLGPFSDQPTWTSGLRHRLLPGSRPDLFVAQKLALLRLQPWMRLTEGLHYVGGARVAPRNLVFGHFKYNAQFRAKAEAEVARRQHFNDAEEYRKYLALISEGRETIFDPAHSAPWAESAFIRHLFASGHAPGDA